MPWKEAAVMEERLRFVLRAFKSNENFTGQCRRFGISTKTGYKWLKRFEDGGVAGLKDRPTIAKEIRNKTDDKTQRRIISLKERYKSWGAKKIRALYMKKYPGGYVPCRSTIEDIFKREGFTRTRRRRAVCAHMRDIRRCTFFMPPLAEGDFVDLGLQPPEYPDELPHHTMASRTPHTLTFEKGQRGKTVQIALCWQNERGITGQWSEYKSAIIP